MAVQEGLSMVLDLAGGDGIVGSAHGSLRVTRLVSSHSRQGTCACNSLLTRLQLHLDLLYKLAPRSCPVAPIFHPPPCAPGAWHNSKRHQVEFALLAPLPPPL